MPHSLRAKIKGLRYKGIITDKDCERLCKALDKENVLEQIGAQIEDLYIITNPESDPYDGGYYTALIDVRRIIDKYKGE